jgi:hypothetical protein
VLEARRVCVTGYWNIMMSEYIVVIVKELLLVFPPLKTE